MVFVGERKFHLVRPIVYVCVYVFVFVCICVVCLFVFVCFCLFFTCVGLEIVPTSDFHKPAIILKIEDFPFPEGPMTTIDSMFVCSCLFVLIHVCLCLFVLIHSCFSSFKFILRFHILFYIHVCFHSCLFVKHTSLFDFERQI